MNTYIVFSLALLIFLLLLNKNLKKVVRQKKTSKKEQSRKNHIESWLDEGKQIYRGKSHLMTPTEQKFFHYLKKQFGENKRVFAHVRVVDLIQVNWSVIPKNSFEEKLAFRQISQWHVDYVITNQDFKIICAAELDDESHEKPERKRRDKILNQAFESAGIKLYRYKLEKNDPRLLEAT